MTDLMTIGEFASATWLSPKALRLYDRNGLLTPDSVDPFNGYRKYSHAQIETARLITLLRRIDMPLEQISELLTLSPAERSIRIASYREHEAEQHARRQSLATFLEHAVAEGALEVEGQPEYSRFEVALRSVPDTAMLTTTRHTSARELPEVIRSTVTRLIGLAEERGGVSGGPIVVYHGQVGWESDGPIEVCVPLRERQRAHRVEPVHEELFTRVVSKDVQFPRILAVFDAVRTRAEQLGFVPAGSPREIYPSDDQGSVPCCEVALPIIPHEEEI